MEPVEFVLVCAGEARCEVGPNDSHQLEAGLSQLAGGGQVHGPVGPETL